MTQVHGLPRTGRKVKRNLRATGSDSGIPASNAYALERNEVISGVETTTVLQLTVEVWKQTVNVQMHFNDLSMRIRSFAITIMGALLSATAIAIERELFFSFAGWTISGAALILGAAAVAVVNFWLMDALWYNRLLAGASKEALRLEAALRKQGLVVELTSSLRRETPIPIFWGRFGSHGKIMRSKHKMLLFYSLLLTIVLVVLVNVVVTVRPAN